ncbi:uncharacterized protein [Aquarana catesbeiana]|uniref:uncharacterized protein n=1 Tax=Aquarana catesbeiana TaxID=8400 RepID=UPI003CCA5466
MRDRMSLLVLLVLMCASRGMTQTTSSSTTIGSECTDSLGCSDPCVNRTVLNESWRSVNYTQSSILNCDYSMTGWYQFNSSGGDRISEYCVPDYTCNTDIPLWMNGTHPVITDGIVSRTVCANWNGSCCYLPLTIQVKACPLGYYVYNLIGNPGPGCPFAYCTDFAPTTSTASIIIYPTETTTTTESTPATETTNSTTTQSTPATENTTSTITESTPATETTTESTTPTVQNTTSPTTPTVQNTTSPTTPTVQNTTSPTTPTVQNTTSPTTPTVQNTTSPTTPTVQNTTSPTTPTVQNTTSPTTPTVQNTTSPTTPTVQNTTSPTTPTVQNTTSPTTPTVQNTTSPTAPLPTTPPTSRSPFNFTTPSANWTTTKPSFSSTQYSPVAGGSVVLRVTMRSSIGVDTNVLNTFAQQACNMVFSVVHTGQIIVTYGGNTISLKCS